MKERSDGNRITAGFSTLEIIIALALMTVIIVGAVHANIASQYWSLTSETANEGLYKAKGIIEEMRAVASADFQAVGETAITRSEDTDDPTDAACIGGGMCYFLKRQVTEISSCSKYVGAEVSWSLGRRYPTTTVNLYTNLTNNNEIVASYGDCTLNAPEGNWLSGTPIESGSASISGSNALSMDVLQKKVYVTSESSPQLKIYTAPTSIGSNPSLLGSTAGKNRRLNDVDVIRDLSTGRSYAFVMQHATTSQVAVFDVTDASAPVFVMEKPMSGVDKAGSFPEGWRVSAYGNRLYATTRETAGPELHIFNINAPVQPTEVVSAATDLNRTVNDMIVREQLIDGDLRRFLFLAASSDLREVTILEVTDDSVSQLVALNLPNGQNALSLHVTGNRLFVGRQQNSGPELYVFDIRDLLDGETDPLGSAEVDADITSIKGAGDMLFLGTSKSGQQFQVWNSDETTWDAGTLNAGRISSLNSAGLLPLGIDIGMNFVYLHSNSLLRIIRTP